MSYVIKIVSTCGQAEANPLMTGCYIQSFDHDADDGRGSCVGTRDVRRALRFESPARALEFIRRQSTVRPLREDGQPNRPLTATNNAVIEVED